MIVGLASKNNTISVLTGISYEKVRSNLLSLSNDELTFRVFVRPSQLNFFHRSASRASLIICWLHVFGRSVAIPLGKDNQIGETHMIVSSSDDAREEESARLISVLLFTFSSESSPSSASTSSLS